MKNIYILIIMIFAALNVNAQMVIKSPNANLDVKVTRAVLAGDRLIIDMMLENLGSDSNIQFDNRWITATDDEANEYSNKTGDITMGFTGQNISSSCSEKFPQEIPLRFRMQISGIVSTASQISLLKIGVKSYNDTPYSGYIEIKNLVIEK